MARNKKSIGCGMFLVIAGVLLLAERKGWFYVDSEWILPAILIAVGAAYVLDAIR